jgi:hypothetical protein
MSTQDASTYMRASEGTPNRRVQFESTRAGDQPGGSPPSIGASPAQASAVRNQSSAQPSNNTNVSVVNETGSRSKVRGTVLKQTMSGFGGLFRPGAQLERDENVELTTVPKDGKQTIYFIFSTLHDP